MKSLFNIPVAVVSKGLPFARCEEQPVIDGIYPIDNLDGNQAFKNLISLTFCSYVLTGIDLSGNGVPMFI